MIAKLLACTVLAGAVLVAGASAQNAPGYTPPKTSWGAPDIQGFWNSTSITSLQRPAGVEKLVVSEAEGRSIVNDNPLIIITQLEAESQGSDPNDTSILADKNADRGYNAFWIDPGTSLANFDDPETRPLFERCIMTESMAGPVMQNAMYNSTLQIVQSPEAVVIVAEMVHHARIIPIVADAAAAQHGPDVIPKWAGDSVGWYEGDTLVVETRNVHPQQPSLISKTGKVTERFSRWSDGQVLYAFTVEDPSLYTQAWRGEMALNTSQQMYEFACHEGNHAMPGILGGARELEAQGITPTVGPGIAAGLTRRSKD
jgi:hypothetical protein